MSLTLILDAPVRLILEPGFRKYFSAAELAQQAQPASSVDARQLFVERTYGTIMLKPLQMQPDFLNHPQQLTSGAVLRLASIFANPADIVGNLIWEASVGTASNPWIFHTPASPYVVAPTLAPAGLTGSTLLQGITNNSTANASETSLAGVWNDLANPAPQDLRLLVDTNFRFPANQGFYVRWHMPDSRLVSHQTIYAFTFGQYLAVCRDTLLEIFRDVSAHGDRTAWQKQYSAAIFSTADPVASGPNLNWPFGQQVAGETPGGDRSLLVLPCRRNRILFWANTGRILAATSYNNPQLLADGSDYDILRSDSLQVWALTSVVGRFQCQKLMFEGGPATFNMPAMMMEFTPAADPLVILQTDVFHQESLLTTLQFPVLYAFPTTPQSNDCPPPTTQATGVNRTYGATVTLGSSPDQLYSPQFYGFKFFRDPIFQDNPATATAVLDQSGASRITSAEISLGSEPGQGQLTARVLDIGPSYPLAPYYYRSEMPVQLQLDGAAAFTGWTQQIETRPLRLTGAPVELTLRATDNWLLMEQTFLREQEDWTGIGHITAVDNIVKQCGIDTGSPAGTRAEYPTGWNTNLASQYNTPLGTPILTPDNQEGNQLLGWKPQINDTGASFLKRIIDYYSGWLAGFRMDGTFYYLPYTYFTTPTVTFHAFHGGVSSGLVPTAGAGLSVSVSGGAALVQGAAVSPSSQTVSGLTPNATNSLYLDNTGTAMANTTGAPTGTIGLGTAITGASSVTSVDTSAGSGRQLATDPVYRSPVEHRTIEPSGNVVQVVTHYQTDLSANRSGLWVDWASIKNPAAPNYLGHYKWFIVEIAGAFSCPQLNAMAYIVFKSARRRRKRVSFDAPFVPSLKIGQVFTLEGYGQYRLLEFRGQLLKSNWEVVNYTGESTEQGF